MEECSRRFGPWFTLRLPDGPPLVFTSSPEAVRDVFAADPDKLCAGEANSSLKRLLGENSLVVLDGQAHRRARRLMMPPFHGDRMIAYGKTIGELTKGHIARWPRGEPLRMLPAMRSLSLDVILATMFGASESDRRSRLRDALTALRDLFPEAPSPGVNRKTPSQPPAGGHAAVRQEIDEILASEIADRKKAGGAPGDDVLSLLIAARDPEGGSLSDEELRDQMVTLLLTGHETTATGLSWIFHRLTTHPAVLKTLREQLRGASGEPEKLMGLPYLDGVINETFRLNPVAVIVGRIVKSPMTLGGRDLPAGVMITPCIYLIHRSPDLWPDPEKFDPDRFARSHPAPWEFLPFGGGGRRCLGAAFAMYEIKQILGHVLESITVRPAANYSAKMVRQGNTLRPSEGLPLIVEESPLHPTSVR
jgi:cytochrome P450